MEPGSALSWVSMILGFLSPIVVIVVSTRSDRSRKLREAEQRAKEVETENDKKERKRQDEEMLKMITDVKTEVGEIRGELSDLRKQVERMQEVDRGVQQDLRTLKLSTGRANQYSRELAKVIQVLASGLRDNHLDGTLTKALIDFQNFESSQLDQLVTDIPLSSANDQHPHNAV